MFPVVKRHDCRPPPSSLRLVPTDCSSASICVTSLNMRKWMRDRLQGRKKKAPEPGSQPAPPPLQPAYFDAEQAPFDAGIRPLSSETSASRVPEGSARPKFRRLRSPSSKRSRPARNPRRRPQPAPPPKASAVVAAVAVVAADAEDAVASKPSLRPSLPPLRKGSSPTLSQDALKRRRRSARGVTLPITEAAPAP